MEDISNQIIEVRRKVFPRTSYATSGSAASCLFILNNSNSNSFFEQITQKILESIKSSKEFEDFKAFDSESSMIDSLNGNVLIIFFRSNIGDMIQDIFSKNKSKLVFSINEKLIDNKLNINSSINSMKINLSGVYLYCFFKQNSKKSSCEEIGFNGQPSVSTGTQFKYLWKNNQNEEGKLRVIQRISDREPFEPNSKFSPNQWNDMINALIEDGIDDYGIYDFVRQKTLGRFLKDDLVFNPTHPDEKRNEEKIENSGEGRANFLVDRTFECIPQAVLEKFTSKKLKSMLDYGCAEGSITLELGKKLGLEASHIFGADVRLIPSAGFHFLLLPSEGSEAPEVGTILPSIESNSIGLINAAMVFHHVTYVKSALLELRRVIHDDGVLVLREHHCTSPDMAAFLDITHGLYSLAWSLPVEWPSFIDEYKAFYRSREEWTKLLAECGFELWQPLSKQAKFHYDAAEKSLLNKKGRFPNVIKAYYAIYGPIKGFNPMINNSVGHKRPTKMDETIINKKPNTGMLSDEIFESKKYPGRYYRINKETGASVWI